MSRLINSSRPWAIIFPSGRDRAAMFVTILVVLGAAYLYFLIFAWRCADRIIFAVPRSSYVAGPDYFSVSADDGVPLTCVHLMAPGAKATLLYLHGNGEDLGDLLPHLRAIQERGVSVFAFDYRGYGTTPGTPTEANLYADVLAVRRHLLTKCELLPEQVVVYGRSLGSGPGVFLAASELVGGLVLEGAFTTAFQVATQIPILPMDRFRNLSRLSAVNCPVLVMHSLHDKTVPFAHGRRLFAAANEPKYHLWIHGVQHNDFAREPGEEYWDALQAFLQTLKSTD